jgi:phosphotransferase system enzyme I (PtsI)
MMAADPMLEEAVQERLAQGETVEAAVTTAAESLAAILAGMGDELFAARATDMRDVGRRLLRLLLDVPDTSLDALSEPSIIVAQELTPTDTASLKPDLTLGFCTAAGGLTSHTAILARTLGLPAVVGLGASLLAEVDAGQPLILNGSAGIVITDPTSESIRQAEQELAKLSGRRIYIEANAARPAATADGQRVEVGANIGDIESAKESVRLGAEGIGLLRTEFLYLQDTLPPSEDRQMRAYRTIFEVMGDRPVIVRTLDIGGDKPPSYLKFDPELNPFLGWRAIRICLEDRTLFKTQLRAILRAAVGHPVRIMYPMINDVEELRAANRILETARQELESGGLAFSSDVPVGIMIETPAAAALADVLIRECDFFSIGTNDLTQYTLAVDRTNAHVAHLFQPLHPAVLRLIKQSIDAAHAQGKWVGMCGELAGMRKAIPILLGMALDEFSMVPRAIPEAKWLIDQLTIPAAREIAAHALSLPTASDVEEYMQVVLTDLRSEPVL